MAQTETAIVATRPIILILCTTSTAPGHVLPLCQIARHLLSKGFEVTFVGGVQHQATIESTGATFFPIHESITLEKGEFRKWGMERQKYEEGLPRMRQDLKTFFMGQIPGQFKTTQNVLSSLAEKYPGKQLIVVNETIWFGFLPFIFGAQLPAGMQLPKSLGISVGPLFLDSADTPPMPLGLMPDSSSGCKERDAALRQLLYRYVLNESYDGFRDLIKSCGGGQVPDDWMMNISITAHTTTLQLCDPHLEWPRSDLPSSIKFAGSLPRRPIPADFVYPDWWSQVLANFSLTPNDPARKRVVVVSQGTLGLNYTMLIGPTLRGLAARPDLLVIALLGKRGATLPPELLPAGDNIRIADYFPYDAVLPYADVFVQSGGWGGVNHGLVNGVPMVVAGQSEEKMETTARVEWSGAGINLRTGRPRAEEITAAVYRILTQPEKYAARSKYLAEQAVLRDPLAIVENEVLALCEVTAKERSESKRVEAETAVLELAIAAPAS